MKRKNSLAKTLIVAMLLPIAINLTGCPSAGGGGGNGGGGGGDTTRNVSVTFSDSEKIQNSVVPIFSRFHSSQNEMYSTAASLTTDTYYKDTLKDGVRGALLNEYDASQFILNINGIGIFETYPNYTADGTSTTLLGPYGEPSSGTIPQHYNMLYAKDIIRDFEISSDAYLGMYVNFIAADETNGNKVMSIVGIDLPTDYDSVTLPNELSESDGYVFPEAGLHYFKFGDLLPFENGWKITELQFLNTIDQGQLEPPSNVADPPDFVLPAGNIDFTNFNEPEIVFSYDMANLIQVYEGPTDDDDDDIVTFNLSDPFPVSLTVRERVALPDSSSSDTTPPPDVFSAYISNSGSTFNTLVWVNPAVDDFSHVKITRKVGSAPSDHTDGDVVYEGYRPSFCDYEGTSATNYYYLITSVDTSGNHSGGLSFNQVQP